MEPDLPPDPTPAPDPSPEPAAVPPALAQEEIPAAPPPVVASAAPAAPAYRDRSTGLVIFGVAQVILGLLSALMVPLVALGLFVSRMAPGGGARPGQFFSSVSVYAFVAVIFVCLGIGSVQAKRWAHALTLVISCYWLFSGALITVLLTAVLPVTTRAVLQAQQNAARGTSPDLSTGVMAVMLTIMIVFAAFFLIVVPIGFIVFYSRNDVAETCRHRDPVERWTDRSPLPVLGASVVLAIQALYLLVVGVGTPLFPFFGRYLYGFSGFGCFLFLALLDGYIAFAMYRLKSAGWWIAVLTIPVRILSMAITYSRADLMFAYSKMGMSDQQLRMLQANPLMRSHVFLWWGLLSTVVLYGYILWLKRYFKAPAGGRQPAPALPAEAS